MIDSLKRYSLIAFCALFASYQGYCQSQISISGMVLNAENNEPVQFATVYLEETRQWAITNEKGVFEIRNVFPKVYQLASSSSGFIEYEEKIEVNNEKNYFTIRLKESSLKLEEIVVTAREQRLSSTSTIGQKAIEHLQPKSISDVLQLLPGHITENPSLSSPKQIKIREISEDNNSALGAAVIVDGIPLSNNSNLQVFSTARTGSRTTRNMPSVANRGVDLRAITTDNIESVEVIRGIPSVVYGDLTSGAVIVKTKSGKTPFEAKVAIDPVTKIAYIGKGFSLKKNRGILNTSLDLTQSFTDNRLKFKGYNRLTASLGYTTKLFKTLSFNTKIAVFKTLDDFKSDPQLSIGEAVYSSNQGIRIGISGKWKIDNPFFDNLSYNFSYSASHQEGYSKKIVTLRTGTMPLSSSYKDGENIADYLPSEYFSEVTIDGKPFHFFGRVISNSHFKLGKSYNNLKLGLEFRSSGNNGNGRIFDLKFSPVVNSPHTIRPRPYKDIPSITNFSLFAEDGISIPIRSTTFSAKAGIRINFIQPSQFLLKNFAISPEPRINLSYQILDKRNNSVFDDFSLRFGYGIAGKSPTLLHLYPDKAYYDEQSFNYYDGARGSLAVMTTKIIHDTSNPNLKVMKSKKKELGLDFSIKKIKGMLTVYYEKQTNGYSFNTIPHVIKYKKYTVQGAGKKPFFIPNDGVYYYENNKKVKANHESKSVFELYRKPTNNYTLIKKGIEFSLNIGKIAPIKTSFFIDGAWLFTEDIEEKPQYMRIIGLHKGKPVPYVALMPGRRTIRQRMNTNLRTIIHVPSIRMVLSLVTQVVWFNNQQEKQISESGKSRLYEIDENNQIVKGVEADNQSKRSKHVAPIGYLDKSGVFHKWEEKNFNTPPFSLMVTTRSYGYYLEETLPIVAQFNIKLTKELSKNLDLAFTANNFLNIRPTHRLIRSQGFVERNTPIYFGTEIKFKF